MRPRWSRLLPHPFKLEVLKNTLADTVCLNSGTPLSNRFHLAWLKTSPKPISSKKVNRGVAVGFSSSLIISPLSFYSQGQDSEVKMNVPNAMRRSLERCLSSLNRRISCTGSLASSMMKESNQQGLQVESWRLTSGNIPSSNLYVFSITIQNIDMIESSFRPERLPRRDNSPHHRLWVEAQSVWTLV